MACLSVQKHDSSARQKINTRRCTSLRVLFLVALIANIPKKKGFFFTLIKMKGFDGYSRLQKEKKKSSRASAK